MKIVIGISIVLLILGFAVNPGFLVLFLVLLGITWLTWLVLKGMVAIYRRFFPRDERTTGMPKKTISFAFTFFIVCTVLFLIAPPLEPDVVAARKAPHLPAEARQFRYEEKERIEKERIARIEKARIADENARIEKARIARIARIERTRIAEEKAEERAEERARIVEEKAEEARQLKNEEWEACVILARRLGYGVFDTSDRCAHLKRN